MASLDAESDQRYVIRELKSLKMLDLMENRIRDISFLEELTSLNYLELSSNQIEDASPVINLRSLVHLDLDHNPTLRRKIPARVLDAHDRPKMMLDHLERLARAKSRRV